MMDSETMRCLDRLVEMALEEDLRGGVDCTSQSVVPESVSGSASFVSRGEGIVCGVAVVERVLKLRDAATKVQGSGLGLEVSIADGKPVHPGQTIATLRGDAQGNSEG